MAVQMATIRFGAVSLLMAGEPACRFSNCFCCRCITSSATVSGLLLKPFTYFPGVTHVSQWR